MPSKEAVTFWLDTSAPMGLLSLRFDAAALEQGGTARQVHSANHDHYHRPLRVRSISRRATSRSSASAILDVRHAATAILSTLMVTVTSDSPYSERLVALI